MDDYDLIEYVLSSKSSTHKLTLQQDDDKQTVVLRTERERYERENYVPVFLSYTTRLYFSYITAVKLNIRI